MSFSSDNFRDDYIGNGVATTFAYNFEILSSADLKVIKKLIASPYTETTLTLNADYTVSGVGEEDGSITLVAGALSSAYTLHILIDPDLTQEVSFSTQSRSDGRTWETSFDSVVNICKRLWRLCLSAIRIPESEDADTYPMTLPGAHSRANKIVGFDSNGQLDMKDSGEVDDLTATFALKADKTTTLTPSAPLTGGGNFSANMTLGISNATTSNAGVVILAADANTSANTAVQGSDSRLTAKYVFCCPTAASNSVVFPIVPCEAGSVSIINTSIQTAMVGSNGTAVFQLIHLGNMAIASNFATVSIPVNTTSINTSFNSVATNTSVGMTTVFTAVGNTTAGTNVTHKVK